jgi:hypothetical protein
MIALCGFADRIHFASSRRNGALAFKDGSRVNGKAAFRGGSCGFIDRQDAGAFACPFDSNGGTSRRLPSRNI